MKRPILADSIRCPQCGGPLVDVSPTMAVGNVGEVRGVTYGHCGDGHRVFVRYVAVPPTLEVGVVR